MKHWWWQCNEYIKRMKSIYFIVFCLLSSLELAADDTPNNNSTTISMSATAREVSDVGVNPPSINRTLADIFDLRDTAHNEEDVGSVVITHQTNVVPHKLTLTSAHTENDKFYLYHSSYTSENKLRLLLNIYDEDNTPIIPSTTALTTNDVSVRWRDSTHTISVKLQPDNDNAANAGDYNTTLTAAWVAE